MSIKIFNAFFVLFLLVMLLFFCVSKSLHSYWYSQNIELHESVEVVVDKGMSLNALLSELSQEKIIQNKNLTRFYLKIFERDFVLKAGEYSFQGLLSEALLFEQLNSGVSRQYQITIVEGVTVVEALKLLLDIENLDQAPPDQLETGHSEFLGKLLSSQARQMMGGAVHTEGWFFPDTYHYVRNDHPSDILIRSHQRMLTILLEEWSGRQEGLPYQNPYQALIMASLVERETGAVEERMEIAGVFVRRLKKSMRLQTDPSVIYGMGDRYKGNLRRKDLKKDTPYNTYTRHGLPPTPIALPGRGAIHAALNPALGSSLYFVAKGDGSHHFSDTFEEHRQAVYKYQVKNRRSDYRSSPEPQA